MLWFAVAQWTMRWAVPAAAAAAADRASIRLFVHPSSIHHSITRPSSIHPYYISHYPEQIVSFIH